MNDLLRVYNRHMRFPRQGLSEPTEPPCEAVHTVSKFVDRILGVVFASVLALLLEKGFSLLFCHFFPAAIELAQVFSTALYSF